MYVILCAGKETIYLKQTEKTLAKAMTTAVAATKILPQKVKTIVYNNETGEVIFELADR